MDLESITLKVCDIGRSTGHYLLEQQRLIRGRDIELKEEHNFVTYVDRHAEKLIVDELSRILPGSGFLAEEGTGGQSDGEVIWIIDPLDGTTNYIHGIPLFAISIALMVEKQVVAGVVYEPNRDECFYAWKGSHAFLNERVINVSSAETLQNSLIVTGFPYKRDDVLEPYIGLLKGFLQRTQDLRRLGSAATDLAYVAAGRFEGFYEIGLNPWDVAAGSLIIRQAGGHVTDFFGGQDFLFGQSLVASNTLIHNEMIGVIGKYFNKN
ncbi:MAG: inositol monophosphatase [Bacteroidales bacterium]|nr:inositol monophosphatase [Bacteroidales bacterium]